uniref:Uncharacterized protein n=1 Tax=Amphora coffeiformis TaxID=265554 RepID=A0A7S3LFC6_9STRA
MSKLESPVRARSSNSSKRADSPTKKRTSSPSKKRTSSPSKKRLDSPVKVRLAPEAKKSESSKSEKSKRGRSKSRSRKEKKEFNPDDLVVGLVIEPYESWDFGKPKDFKRPSNNKKNNKAATTIQRCMRGWWARILFKIKMMEFKIEHKDLLTKRALAKVKDKQKSKKEKVRRKMEEKQQKSLAKLSKDEEMRQEAQKLIQQLRNENKKLREKNQKVFDACKNLKEQNERLENTTTVAEGNIDTLNKHAKQIEETHKKLKIVEPRYKESVEQLAEAVELRRQFCLTERQMKLMYVKCVGGIVDLAEDKLKDRDLVDEIVGYVLETENVDNEEPVPQQITVEEPESDEDSLDGYSVHSYGS